MRRDQQPVARGRGGQRRRLSLASFMLLTMEIRTASDVANKNRFRRGSAYKVTAKGELYLEFDSYRVVALRPTVPLRAWVTSRNAGARWFGTSEPPGIDPASLIRAVRADDALTDEQRAQLSAVERWRRTNFRRFLEHIDHDVQELMLDGWAGSTWPLFRLLVACPAARALCASNNEGAAVAAALAHAHALFWHHPDHPTLDVARAPRTLALARRILGKPRKHIVGVLGFPAQNASVKAIAKIPRPHIDGATLTLLRIALREPASFKLCCHLPRLPHAVLSVLQTQVLPHVQHSFITELLDDDTATYHAGHFASDVRDAVALFALVHPDKKPPVFSSLAHLRAVHDELVAERQKMIDKHKNNDDAIELAPFPNILTPHEQRFMQPLRTVKELREHGRMMHHCLGTLPEHITLSAQGRLQVLSLFPFETSPSSRSYECLTLALVRSATPTSMRTQTQTQTQTHTHTQTQTHERWSVYDFRGMNNTLPPPHAWHVAQDIVQRMNAWCALPSRSVDVLQP